MSQENRLNMQLGHGLRVAMLLFSVGIAGGCASVPSAATPIAPTSGEAPDFVADRLQGGTLQLSSLRGKVVVLDVWAAWCVGCEKDLPILDDMAARLKAAGIEVLAVSLDPERSRLEPFAKRPWRMTMLHDPSARVGDLYKPAQMPAVFIIDRTGVIRYTRHGFSAGDIKDFEREAMGLAR